MIRSTAVAILTLILAGASSLACTNALEDAGSGEPEYVTGRSKDRRGGSGSIEGDPATLDEEAADEATTERTEGAGAEDAEDEPSRDEEDVAPPPEPGSDDEEAAPPPPADDPPAVPPGSYAAGTELETTANLNMREGEGTAYAIITTIPKGSRVVVKTTSGASGWVHVAYDRYAGYASKAYLRTLP